MRSYGLRGFESHPHRQPFLTFFDTIAYGLASVLNEATQGEDGRLAMFSLTEAMEFLDIHAAFRGEAPAGLRSRLRDALQGPTDPVDESPDSNRARNIMFELNVASRLLVRGIPVALRENPDVLCELLGTPIYLQCKRPFRATTIAVNIDNARHQLIRDLDGAGNPDARGIVAISVSRVFNPGDQLFAGRDEATLKDRLGDEVQALGKSVAESWNGIAEGRIIGILFHLITPTHLQDINLLTVGQQTVVFPISGRVTEDIELLREFARAISEA